ncbi:MAG: flagellar export protein FliJ [Candidatus Woesearchaeota archaeon]|nr:flagellar export protein FliJ [Candidatus Woesearchaeota archaeon]
MAKFIFKLQSLLNVKMQMEDNLKNELGKATQKLENEKERLRQIENERIECINQVSGESSRGIMVGKLKEYSAFISFLKEKAELQKENINYAQNVVDKYREQLIKVVQEKEMLEKLKEKKFKEYLKEQFKEEQKINDEITSYKYNKTLGEQNG